MDNNAEHGTASARDLYQIGYKINFFRVEKIAKKSTRGNFDKLFGFFVIFLLVFSSVGLAEAREGICVLHGR